MTSRTVAMEPQTTWTSAWTRLVPAAKEALSGADTHEQAIVYRELSVMLKAGIMITRALDLVAGSVQSRRLAEALRATRDGVQKGARLSAAMALQGRAFSPMAVELIQVGEQTGALDGVLDRLAGWFEGRLAMQQKVRAALTYPLLVAALSLGILLVVPAFLMDGVFAMLADLKVDIPPATRAMMALSAASRSPWTWLALAAGTVGALHGYAMAMASPAGRLARDRFLLRTKGLGPCLRMAAVASFASSLSVAVEAGVPIMKALRLAARGSGNLVLEEAAEEAAKGVEHGAGLHVSLAATEFFPPAMLRLLAAGEESGRIAEMLDRYRRMAEADVEAALDAAVAALEPAVMMVMGLVVGAMALAMLSPLLKAMEAMAL